MKQAAIIANHLRRKMTTAGWTQLELSKNSGVDQSQISRILNGEFVRITKNVKTVCKYAEVNLVDITPLEPLPEAVTHALRNLLDGSKEREQAVVGLLKAEARLLRRSDRRPT